MLVIAGGLVLGVLVLFVARLIFIWAGIHLLRWMDRDWERFVKKGR